MSNGILCEDGVERRVINESIIPVSNDLLRYALVANHVDEDIGIGGGLRAVDAWNITGIWYDAVCRGKYQYYELYKVLLDRLEQSFQDDKISSGEEK